MSVATQTEPQTDGGGAWGEGVQVALLSSQPDQLGIASLLESVGLGIERFESLEALGEQAPGASLVLLCIEGALSSAVAERLGPLRREIGPLPIVIVCSQIRPGELRAAIAAGARGVVLEGDLELALVPCLSAALAGQICGPAQHSRQIEPAALSSREKQILGLVVMGYMNSQIAEQLFLAESTVKSHLSSAFAKLDVRSRHDAVELILDAERGLGLGILALGGDPLPAATSTAITD